jgi:hypothetical protein
VPKTEALFDLLDRDGPVLLRDNHGAWRAPLFAIDWKESAKVEAAFGWPRLDRELRVRTAIDSERQRAASEQLFAQELVVPAPEVAWLASVDLGAIEDTPARDRVRGQLRELLLGGLRGLGKTKAPVAVALLPPAGDAEAWPRRGPASGEEPWRGRHSVLLQTPALLCDPEGVFPDRDVASAYDEVWKELSGGALRLVRFFARQSLAGGEYREASSSSRLPQAASRTRRGASSSGSATGSRCRHGPRSGTGGADGPEATGRTAPTSAKTATARSWWTSPATSPWHRVPTSTEESGQLEERADATRTLAGGRSPHHDEPTPSRER